MPANNLTAFAQRLQQFADSYEQTAEGIIRAHSDDIADLQAKQLAQGINSKGQTINPPYKPFTIEQKKQKGQEYRFVTFRDTGDLYRRLRAVVQGGKFTVTADTFKFQKAEQRSGVATFGLTKDSRLEFRDHVSQPEMKRAFEQSVLKS